MQVTSLEELKQISEKVKGEVIEIPGFSDDSTLRVRVRQVSLLDLVQCDILPNALLLSVNKIIQTQQKGELSSGKDAAIAKKNMEQFTEIVCKAALVEPSTKDFKDTGIELTLTQKRMIAEYSIGDKTTYERFRKFREGIKSNNASEVLS